MLSVKLVFVAISLALGILGSEATKCYKCSGEPSGDCAKAVVSAMEIETCTGLSVCRYVDDRTGSTRSVDRGCTKYGSVDLCTVLYQMAAMFPIGSRIFACNTCWGDLCNVQVTP